MSTDSSAENVRLLADWFASMCQQDAGTPHDCDTLIAAHDVARMIRERRSPHDTRLPDGPACRWCGWLLAWPLSHETCGPKMGAPPAPEVAIPPTSTPKEG